MWKELAISAAAIALINTSCGDNPSMPSPEPSVVPSYSERIGVENAYSWLSPGGTIFEFDAINFPGTFYPNAITQALGKYCDKPLAVPNVRVLIEPVVGFNPKTLQPDSNGVRGISIMRIEKSTNKPVELTIGIAGRYFEKLRGQDKYYYASPHLPNNQRALTNALHDLNGSIAEEVGYHACIATVGTPLDRPNAQAESARFHMNFLKNPTVMFRPKGW